jgi:hypothetical protein
VKPQRQRLGSLLIRVATLLLGLLLLVEVLYSFGVISVGFPNWQPILIAYVLWSVALCWGLVLRDGEMGWRALFVLPAILFTLALVIFPTFFGFFIAFSDWNLQSAGAASSTASTISASSGAIPISGTRSATWCSMSRPWSCNMPSPSGWRCC